MQHSVRSVSSSMPQHRYLAGVRVLIDSTYGLSYSDVSRCNKLTCAACQTKANRR
jgi:hypothetical protein